MEKSIGHINRKANYVKVPYGVQKQLAEMFHVSKTTISDTLMQKHRGKNYKEIVKKAMEMGGEWVN